MSEDVKKVLLDTKSLLKRKEWCKEHYATDDRGYFVPYQENAFAYCLLGAVRHVTPSEGMVREGAIEALAVAIKSESSVSVHERYVDNENRVVAYNDCIARTKTDVLHVIDKAIELLDM